MDLLKTIYPWVLKLMMNHTNPWMTLEITYKILMKSIKDIGFIKRVLSSFENFKKAVDELNDESGKPFSWAKSYTQYLDIYCVN